MRCAICLDTLSDPHMMAACRHVFCGECVTAFLANNKKRALCPLCREETARRSVRQDPIMALLVKSVVSTCAELRVGADLELSKRAPENWRGQDTTRAAVQVVRARQPLPLQDILRLHDEISEQADLIVHTNAKIVDALNVPHAPAPAAEAHDDRGAPEESGAPSPAPPAAPEPSSRRPNHGRNGQGGQLSSRDGQGGQLSSRGKRRTDEVARPYQLRAGLPRTRGGTS